MDFVYHAPAVSIVRTNLQVLSENMETITILMFIGFYCNAVEKNVEKFRIISYLSDNTMSMK